VNKRPLSGETQASGPVPDPPDPLRDTYLQLEQAEALRGQGQLDRARAICEQLVGRYPDYFGALYTLGLIFIDKGQSPQALGCLVRAAMVNPRSWRALTALSAVYLDLGASEMAAHTLERAILIKPQDPNILVTLGEIYREEREYELARDAYRRAYDLDPDFDAAAIGVATCCEYLGRFAEAAEIFESQLMRGKRSLGVLSHLNLLSAKFRPQDLLLELDDIGPDPGQEKAEFENSLAFVRAAILDRASRPREAWDHLLRANRAMHAAKRQEALDLAETQRANLAQLQGRQINIKGDGDAQVVSLFVLGPSRSGKTTMETLASTLEGVKRGYENPGVENAVRRAFQASGLLTTRMFEVLPPGLDALCSEIYLDELARRAGSPKVFTNTHPGRIHDVARVAAAFPKVRFIFMKRDIEDNLLRIYMRKYQSGNAYAYDLTMIRDHIIWYHRMIDLFVEKLPGITRVVHYEDMVADPTAALRVAADLCELPMTGNPLPEIGDDRACAEPYKTLMAATSAVE
jgi:Flp pilus assembly protein TadD